MYKVFINDKPLYLTSPKESSQFSEKKILKLEYISEKEIQVALDALSFMNTYSGVIIISNDETQLWKKFCEQFKIIEAAGGLVWNVKKELLMIYRLKKWDLPKGKIETDENPNKAALREVCEETGVCDCEIIRELDCTYHTYINKEKSILKKTFWFEIKCKSFSGFKVQKEEGIMKAKWMDKETLNNALEKSYSSISELVRAFL